MKINSSPIDVTPVESSSDNARAATSFATPVQPDAPSQPQPPVQPTTPAQPRNSIKQGEPEQACETVQQDESSQQSTSTQPEFRAPSYGKKQATGPQQAASNDTKSSLPFSDLEAQGRVGGAVQTAAGVALMAAGVPLLILPGPGMAAIGGGAVLAGKGVQKIIKG